MKTLFQSEVYSNFETKAAERCREICKKYGGSKELEYAAIDAMIWLSSQPEIQIRNYSKK